MGDFLCNDKNKRLINMGGKRGDLLVLFQKILLDSSLLENLFKKTVVCFCGKNGCCKDVKVSMTCRDVQMEVQVTRLSSAWGTAVPCTTALRCRRRECVFGTSSHGLPPATYYWGRLQTRQDSLTVSAVFITHSLLYGLVVENGCVDTLLTRYSC